MLYNALDICERSTNCIGGILNNENELKVSKKKAKLGGKKKKKK